MSRRRRDPSIAYQVEFQLQGDEDTHVFSLYLEGQTLPRVGEVLTLSFQQDRPCNEQAYTIPEGTEYKLIVQQVEYKITTDEYQTFVEVPTVYVWQEL